MSESSSDQGANGKKRTVAQLVDRLRSKTSTERLSLMAHLSVGRTLCRLRDAIAAGEEVNKKAAMALLCCGISLYRRHTLGDREEEEEDTEETNALIKRSTVLIFVLLAAIEASRGERVDVDNAREIVRAANAATLADVLKIPRRRKRKAREGEGEGEGEAPAPKEAEEAEQWARVLVVSSGELTMSVLQFVSHTIGKSAATDHETLADLFFRNSAACMAHQLLLKSGTSDFVSLKAASASSSNPIPREKRLLSLAQAGESEAGQQVCALYFEPLFSPRTHAYFPPGAQSATTMSLHSFADPARPAALLFAALERRGRAPPPADESCREHGRGRRPRRRRQHGAQRRDGGLRVYLAALEGRARARVHAADGRGHPDNARRRGPHPQARRLRGPRKPALF
jgi:hypothetical protein